MNRIQTAALVTLRLLVGWHLLYEGVAKLLDPYWSSAAYMGASQWWFKGIFTRLAASPGAVSVIDAVNAWGLAIIGLVILVGTLNRVATIAGMVLLALYWLAAPPWVGLVYPLPSEGAYLVVNKVLIEIAALWVLYAFPTSRVWGLDALWQRRSAQPRPAATQA